MKLIAKYLNGEEVEIKEIEGIDEDAEFLVIRSNRILCIADTEKEEQYLSERFGKKVILLDPRYGQILGV